MKKIILIMLALIAAATTLQAKGDSETFIYDDDFHYWAGEDFPDEEGLLISRIIPDSPAEKAGLMRGDILLAIDDQPIEHYGEIREILSEYEAGQEITLTLLRGGEETTVPLTLETRLYHPAIGVEFAFPFMFEMEMPGRFKHIERYGHMTEEGALIIEVLDGSAADEAGLKDGEIILTVDGEEVNDDAPLTALIDGKQPGDSVELLILDPEGGERTVAAVLDKGEDDTAQLGVRILPMGGFFNRPNIEMHRERMKEFHRELRDLDEMKRELEELPLNSSI